MRRCEGAWQSLLMSHLSLFFRLPLFSLRSMGARWAWTENKTPLCRRGGGWCWIRVEKYCNVHIGCCVNDIMLLAVFYDYPDMSMCWYWPLVKKHINYPKTDQSFNTWYDQVFYFWPFISAGRRLAQPSACRNVEPWGSKKVSEKVLTICAKWATLMGMNRRLLGTKYTVLSVHQWCVHWSYRTGLLKIRFPFNALHLQLRIFSRITFVFDVSQVCLIKVCVSQHRGEVGRMDGSNQK